MDEELPVRVDQINSGTRKRRKNKERKSQSSRHEKYQDPDPLALNVQTKCKHKKTSQFKCCKIGEGLVAFNRRKYYAHKGKTRQDVYLTRLISSYNPEQSSFKTKCRRFSSSYFLVGHKKKLVKVCKSFFMQVLGIKRRRLNTIAKTVSEGKIPTENRGGDRKSKKMSQAKDNVRRFISGLKASESHYDRSKSKRIYLNAELNVIKLWKMYNNSCDDDSLKIKRWLFRHIFNCEFNIGFSSPSSDACTQCILLKNRIKSETDNRRKQTSITEKRVHNLRANAFYSFIKEEERDTEFSFCVDLQQVMPLPKTPIQEAFYSRQLSFYNLCIVDLKAKKPHFFCWTENLAGRGSTEVASAILYFLNSQNLDGKVCIRIFCDGCGGQNKNSHVMHTLMFWLAKQSPTSLREIKVYFPVRGHSFLPADRVFGRVEKTLRKHSLITTKEEYVELLSDHGTVNFLGEQWNLLDVKSLEQNYFKKIQGIRDLKRIFFRKVSSRQGVKIEYVGYTNYRFQDNEKYTSLLKSNKTFHRMNLNEVSLGHPITAAKKGDVINLLKKQFGEEWETDPQLNWYVDILINNQARDQDLNPVNENDNEECCECLEPDSGLRV